MLSAKSKNFIEFIEGKTFSIPAFQRKYIWDKNNWEEFVDDIENMVDGANINKHYIGNIILQYNEGTNSYDIIDGQQRLITINLFIKAYCLYKDIDCSDLLLVDDNLRINVNDKDGVFNLILNEYDVPSSISDDSSKNIAKAYKYFENLKVKFDTLELTKILASIILVEIDVKDTNPYLVFETINARGIELNISDLVKNYLIKLDSSKATAINHFWKNVTNKIGIDEFERIFQFYSKTRDTKRRLFKTITKIIDVKGSKLFLKDLDTYIKIYTNLDNPKKFSTDKNLQIQIDYLNQLDSIYKIIVIPTKIKLFNSKEITNILKLCEVLIFRYLIILKKDKIKLENEFFKIAKSILNDEIKTANEIYNKLFLEFFISDEEFKSAFSYAKLIHSKLKEYKYNNQGIKVRYILYKMENHLQGNEILNFSGANNSSIEHICNESATDVANDFKYRLGNYTLLKEEDNNTMGLITNITFNQKKEYFQKSTYILTAGAGRKLKAVDTYNNWKENNIAKRQKQLANLAVQIWKLDGRVFKLESDSND